MLPKTLTIFSLVGLLLSVGLWGVSSWSLTAFKTKGDWYACIIM